jgi:hypothetical protein
VDSPHIFLLLKREGELNTLHSLIEVFSTWITFDVLYMSRDALLGNRVLFRVPEDVPDTQVVILGRRLDSPYFDLWTLFAKHKPLRFKELAKDQDAIAASKIPISLCLEEKPSHIRSFGQVRCYSVLGAAPYDPGDRCACWC